MYRTTIMLPETLKSRVVREAQAQGISLGEFVRGALDAAVRSRESDRPTDSLLTDCALYGGETPTDMADRHDGYLYEAGT